MDIELMERWFNSLTPVAEVMRRGADLVAERAAEIVMNKLESYFNQKAQNISDSP